MTRDTRDTARSIKRLERRIEDLEAQRTSGGLVTILRSVNPQVALRVTFIVNGDPVTRRYGEGVYGTGKYQG